MKAARSLRRVAFSLASGNGCVFFATHPGFGRVDTASGRVELVQAEISSPIALGPAGLVGVRFEFDRAGTMRHGPRLVDQKTGKVLLDCALMENGFRALTASLDGRFIAGVTNPPSEALTQVALFSASTGACLEVIDARACEFTERSELLLMGCHRRIRDPKGLRESGTKVVWRTAESKKPLRTVACPADSSDWAFNRPIGPVQRRDGNLLTLGGFLIDEATGRELNLTKVVELGGYGAFLFGPTAGTIIACSAASTVKVIDFKGRVVDSFERPRQNFFGEVALEGNTLALSSRSFLELYRLSHVKALSSKVKRPRKAPTPIHVESKVANDGPAVHAFFEALRKDPEDTDALAVWADLLTEAGDPRGEWIQMHLAGERERIEVLKRLGGKLVGPAREYLRRWTFARTGLVREAWCDAGKLAELDAATLIEGFEHIAALNPLLELTIILPRLGMAARQRKKREETVAKLARLKLGRIQNLQIDGTLSDEGLAVLVPALKGVETLAIFSGQLTAEGLKPLKDLAGLKSLVVRPEPEVEFLPASIEWVNDVRRRISSRSSETLSSSPST